MASNYCFSKPTVELRSIHEQLPIYCPILSPFVEVFKLISEQTRPSPPSAPKFVPERNITIRETTNSIHGTYKLFDLLDLSSQTGSIHVTVDIQAGTNPAVLRLASQTGTIHVSYTSSTLNGKEEKQDVYDRMFQTTIVTSTGTVHANSLLHGNGGSTVIETKTGSMHVTLYTVGTGPEDNDSTFVTRSSTGSQHVSVQALASKGTEGPLTALRAKHHSTSTASIHAKYPSQWEGVVHAFTKGIGSVHVKGRDLEVQNNGSRDIYAWRGEGINKETTVELISDATGSIHFKC